MGLTMNNTDELIQEIKYKFDFLNLSDKEINRIIKFIKYKGHSSIEQAVEIYYNNFMECADILQTEGYSEKESYEYAKKVVYNLSRTDGRFRIYFYSALGIRDSIYTDEFIMHQDLRRVHARKRFLVEKGNNESQNKQNLFKINDEKFKKRFGSDITKLLINYPITEEVKDVWATLECMNDEKFHEYYGMTRLEMSYLYPISMEELAVIRTISLANDKDIEEKYGMNKNELLNKKPLTKDTLHAIAAIVKSSDKVVQKTFNMEKQEVLSLKTITTEMIKKAKHESFVLKHKMNPEELKQALLKRR